jgi:hypothetical protein
MAWIVRSLQRSEPFGQIVEKLRVCHRSLGDALGEIAATAQGTRVSPRFMTPELGG